jgi:GrpB-like predicted nucleotidyltransferase (UPF0157 family)
LCSFTKREPSDLNAPLHTEARSDSHRGGTGDPAATSLDGTEAAKTGAARVWRVRTATVAASTGEATSRAAPGLAGAGSLPGVEPDLRRRLAEAGVDPAAVGDPALAWRRLSDAFGPRATLLDRYALEAEARGVAVGDLPAPDRRRMAMEVFQARDPLLELAGLPRSDPVEVVPYDPAWAETFARWRGRLAAALGPAAVRIEHIGSTGVAGLAAKPVVDIMVSVPDVEDEAAYLPTLAGLGVPLRSRETGHRYFRPAPPDPREVQIHVWQVGSPHERAHLLFRDYLRAHPAARDAYAAMKLEAAGRYRDDRLAYNEAKSGHIRDVLEAAEGWAVETGWAPGAIP